MDGTESSDSLHHMLSLAQQNTAILLDEELGAVTRVQICWEWATADGSGFRRSFERRAKVSERPVRHSSFPTGARDRSTESAVLRRRCSHLKKSKGWIASN